MKNIKNYKTFLNEEINPFGDKWENVKKFKDKYKRIPNSIDELEEFENRSLNNKNEILSEIVEKIGEDKLTDISYGFSLTPYVYFVYNNKPFTVSLTDKKGLNGEYSTIIVIVETDGITDSLGSFNINETDEVVDVILDYK